MPGILDRYVLRQFLWLFVICFVSLVGLYVVIDVFTNLDVFLLYADKKGAVVPEMARFYGYRVLFLYDRLQAVVVLIAAMFTVAALQRHNEMVALVAAGIPHRRVVLPMIVAGVFFSGAAVLNRELLLPQFKTELVKTPNDLVQDTPWQIKPRYDHRTGILLRGSGISLEGRVLEKPDFLLPPGLDRHGRQLQGQKARWLAANHQHPSGYLIQGVSQPPDLVRQPSLLGPEGEVLIYTPRDASWLKEDEVFVVSGVEPEQLLGGSILQFESTARLLRTLKNPSLDFGADLRVTIHARVVQPLVDLTLLFLGLPLVLGRYQRNLFLAGGLALAVVAGFSLTILGAQYLGRALYLDPTTAAWLPLLIFVPVAAAMGDVWRS